jgi:hypothetical protein
MEPKIIIAAFTCAFICYSCGKNEIAYDGTVYTKNHYPLPGVDVVFSFSPPGKHKKPGYLITTTDAGGKFLLNETIGKRDVMESVSVTSDSGHYESGLSNRKAISNMEIVLE